MRRIRKNSIYDANTNISAIRFGVVSIAQSVEVTDSAVLGGVAEVVSWNPRWAIKIFSAFSDIVDLLYLSISIFIINLYQFLILCSSRVLLL